MPTIIILLLASAVGRRSAWAAVRAEVPVLATADLSGAVGLDRAGASAASPVAGSG